MSGTETWRPKHPEQLPEFQQVADRFADCLREEVA